MFLLYNMKYSIALNSRDRVNGGLASDCEFPFDFGGFKSGDYELSFTMITDPFDMIDVQKTCSIFSNTGGSNVYTTSNVNMANTTQFIGSLHTAGHVTTTGDDSDEQLVASTQDNGGVYLHSAPREQLIKIRLLDGTGTAFTGVTACPEWIMMMTFTKHDDSYPR